jgi:hypothetical protein
MSRSQGPVEPSWRWKCCGEWRDIYSMEEMPGHCPDCGGWMFDDEDEPLEHVEFERIGEKP